MKIEDLIFMLVVFIVFFIINYLFLRNSLKKKDRLKKDPFEVNYLIGRFKLNRDNLFNNKIFLGFAVINSIIVSITATLLSIMPIKNGLQLVISFIVLLVLIFVSYGIYGKILKKRGL